MTTPVQIDAYTRRKLNLINEREGTNYGEDYYMILREEVEAQFRYADFTLAAAGAKGGMLPDE